MKFRLTLFSAALAVLSQGAQAGELGHYNPGIFGTRDFFLPAAPGFYYSQINFDYLSNEFHDSSGAVADSLTISRSLDVSRTFTGSKSFGLTISRAASLSLNYQGSHLDLGAQLTAAGSATANLTLNAEAVARLRAQATIHAHLDDLDVRIAGIAPTFVWASETKFLGARVGALVSLPIVDMKIKALVSGTADVNARVDGQLTLRGTASLAATATANGTVSVTGPKGNTIQPSGSKTITASATRSATITRSISADLHLQRHFTLDIEESGTALGDLYVQPLWLDWSGDHYDVSLSDGFYAPTGRYHDGALDNTGMGFWTNQTQLAAAWYPWKSKGTALTVATTYEAHGNKQGADIQPGDNLTVNWGVSQYLPLNATQTVLADVGFGGYDLWQVSDDRGSGVTYDPSVHDQVHAYGVQFGLAHVKWNATLTLRWMHEYGARDRFQGNMFAINFAKKF